jgi:transposase-like protein
MELHRNAKLGLSGRFALVQARASGMSVREVARGFGVSLATVSRWSCRWEEASEEERSSLLCLFDRSSRPKRMPRMLPAREQRRICGANHVHPRTVQRLVERGELEVVHLGAAARFDPTDVADLTSRLKQRAAAKASSYVGVVRPSRAVRVS